MAEKLFDSLKVQDDSLRMLVRAVHKTILKDYDPAEVTEVGQRVTIDALRRKPKLPGITTAPDALNRINSLVEQGIDAREVYRVGETVIIARELAVEPLFFDPSQK